MNTQRNRLSTAGRILALAVFMAAQSAVADTPVANDQTVSVVVYGESGFYLSWSDPGGHARSSMVFTILSPPVEGVLECYNQRYSSVDYPDYYYYRSTNQNTGTDSFTWQVSDGTLTSGVATCTVNINPNNPPTVYNQSATVMQGTVLKSVTLSCWDSDAGQIMSYSLVSAPVNGTLYWREWTNSTWIDHAIVTNTPLDTKSWYYTPNPEYTGPDPFSWLANDGIVNSSMATYSLTVVSNTPPLARDLKLIVPTNEAVSRAVCFFDPDTAYGQTLTFQQVSPPSFGTLTSFSVNSGVFSYTPNAGFTGEDQFTWQVSDGPSTSSVAAVKFLVRGVRDRTNVLVDVIVDSVVFPEIQVEAQRLADDLRNEGYVSRVTVCTNNGAQAVWNHLRATYDGTNFLSGAILIGAVPVPQCPNGNKTDVIYWNMEGYNLGSYPSGPFEIWVSRIIATGNGYGDEITLLKRALDANHDFRTGQSRYLDTARAYAVPEFSYDNNNVDSLTNVWTHLDAQVRGGFQPAWTLSGVLLQAGSHGSADSYEGVSRNWIHSALAQVRYCVISACSCGSLNGIANNQTLTRGGGNLISVGASAVCGGDYVICSAGSPDTPFRDRLEQGYSWGQSAIYSYPWSYSTYTMVYGDLSLGAHACDPATGLPYPENQKPEINTFTVGTTTPAPGEPVTFTIAVTDPDAGSPHNPQLPFDHQVEWFMNGHNYGRNPPTYVTNDISADWTNQTHVFSSAGTYTIRAEVMDEWKARTWAEMTITVNTPPVASNDMASVEANHSVTIDVLANDSDPDGALTIQSCTQPGHGTAAVVENSIAYTSTSIWSGLDTFTYTIRDSMNATASATVTVSVAVDVTAPVLLGAACIGDRTIVTVTFDEKVQAGSGANGAENPANYALDHGASVTAAVLQPDGKTVKLTTSAIADATTYTLTVNNVGDLASPPNQVAVNSQASFQYSSLAPGLAYEYYQGSWASGGYLPDFSTLTPVTNGTVATVSLSPRLRDTDFAFRYTGKIQISTTGSYTFYTSSDDGSKLFIGGAQVVNNDGPHGIVEQSGTLSLGAGFHDIVVTFCQGSGGYGLTASWQGPGISKQAIPGSVLLCSGVASNVAPAIAGGASVGVTMSEDGSPTAFDLTLNATDGDGDTLTWSLAALAGHGSATASGTGTNKAIGYVPAANYNGTDSFAVQVSDGMGGVDAITVNVTIEPVHDGPTVGITSPAGGAVLKAGTNLTIEATASITDGAGTISRVEFYRDGANIGEDPSAPYTCEWSDMAIGSYTLTAEAIESGGVTGVSEAVQVFVTASGEWEGVVATGGTVTNYTVNGTNYTAHIFTTVGTTGLTVAAGGSIEVLVVAGGGGGGSNGGGGGGGGGVIYSNGFTVSAGSYTVIVGGGGPTHPNDSSNPKTGTNSVFGPLTALGGGGGSSRDNGGQAASGGSGGGGGGAVSAPRYLAGSGTAGQGNSGGNGSTPDLGANATGGGGGGAGSPGTVGVSQQAGNGGTGACYAAFANLGGSPGGWFAGGGGGGRVVNGNNGTGGTGGGGAANVPGVANTGGGGGGGGSGGAGAQGGGSGIVIVRYVTGGTPNPDADGDGVPDVWETQYFGGTSTTNGAPTADPDHDGLNNLQEYLAGTDPTNAASVLCMSESTIRNPQSEIVLRWQSASNRWYTVLAATNLLTGFVPVPGGSNILATYPVNVYTDDTATVRQKFYRIKVGE